MLLFLPIVQQKNYAIKVKFIGFGISSQPNVRILVRSEQNWKKNLAKYAQF